MNKIKNEVRAALAPDPRRDMLMVLSDGNPALIPGLLKLDRFLLFDWYYMKLVEILNERIEGLSYMKHIKNIEEAEEILE